MVIIRSWPCPKRTFILLYTALNLKACMINNALVASAESKKVRDVSKGGSPEEHPYDVSRGQNRYVTLPLTTYDTCINIRSTKYPFSII